MIINIKDKSRKHIEMEANEEKLEIAPWIVLNLDEIGSRISFICSMKEKENITEDIIDDEINEYFSFIHEYIFAETVIKLEEKGIEISWDKKING